MFAKTSNSSFLESTFAPGYLLPQTPRHVGREILQEMRWLVDKLCASVFAACIPLRRPTQKGNGLIPHQTTAAYQRLLPRGA